MGTVVGTQASRGAQALPGSVRASAGCRAVLRRVAEAGALGAGHAALVAGTFPDWTVVQCQQGDRARGTARGLENGNRVRPTQGCRMFRAAPEQEEVKSVATAHSVSPSAPGASASASTAPATVAGEEACALPAHGEGSRVRA